VLLDGPRKQQQLENLQTIIRNVGEAGIPVIGYNFSIAGVWGHVVGPFARGGAETVGFLGPEGPKGLPQNNIYHQECFNDSARGSSE
jgi:mannonate dehydratase